MSRTPPRLSVVHDETGAAAFPTRPEPPADLPAAAARIWRAVALARPAGYWDAGSLPLLRAYAVAAAEHDRVTLALAGIDPATDPVAYARLSRCADALAGRLAQLATRARLSQQSRYDARAAGRAAGRPGRPDAATIRDRYRGES